MWQSVSLKVPPRDTHSGAILVLTADAGRVRIFSAKQSDGELVELADLCNPAMGLQEGEATSTPKNHVMQGPGETGQTLELRHTQSAHSAESFARYACEIMETVRQAEEVARIYLIVEPSFFGLIRKHINPATKPLIVKELPRDMCRQPAADIRKALPWWL